MRRFPFAPGQNKNAKQDKTNVQDILIEQCYNRKKVVRRGDRTFVGDRAFIGDALSRGKRRPPHRSGLPRRSGFFGKASFHGSRAKAPVRCCTGDGNSAHDIASHPVSFACRGRAVRRSVWRAVRTALSSAPNKARTGKGTSSNNIRGSKSMSSFPTPIGARPCTPSGRTPFPISRKALMWAP